MDYTFTECRFMTPKDKQQVLTAWVRFLKSGCSHARFSHSLYQHLTLHCSFIAHFNRDGFFQTYFDTSVEATQNFFAQFDGRGPCESAEYGGLSGWKSGDYRDINEAMIAEAAPFIPGILAKFNANQKESDIALARALFAKHGVTA